MKIISEFWSDNLRKTAKVFIDEEKNYIIELYNRSRCETTKRYANLTTANHHAEKWVES